MRLVSPRAHIGLLRSRRKHFSSLGVHRNVSLRGLGFKFCICGITENETSFFLVAVRKIEGKGKGKVRVYGRLV